jgi:hypothetical protein
MSDEINKKIIQLSAIMNGFTTELNLSKMTNGQKFLAIQEVMLALESLKKIQKSIKDSIIEQTQDLKIIEKETERVEFEGIEVYYKIAFVKPKLDAEKLAADYSQLLADYNIEYKSEDYLVSVEPRRTLVVQKVLDK